MSAILQLAQRFARLKHASAILSHREDGQSISFVLESGHKYTFTAGQLEQAVRKYADNGAVPAPDEPAAPKARKAKE